MAEYLVKWEIEVDAESEVYAAQIAWLIQQNPKSTATCFSVKGEEGEMLIDVSDAFEPFSHSLNRSESMLNSPSQIPQLEDDASLYPIDSIDVLIRANGRWYVGFYRAPYDEDDDGKWVQSGRDGYAIHNVEGWLYLPQL